jgi:hypothetical protein
VLGWAESPPNYKLLGGSTRRPEVNSHARPCGDLYDNIARLLFNAP